jgi:uncharacterized protein YkwD
MFSLHIQSVIPRLRAPFLAALICAASVVLHGSVLQPGERQLFDLANQARAAANLRPLRWDPALAMAARAHAIRMSQEGPISHQYAGEANLTERGGQAGAHFSLIEENIGVGSTLISIHEGWLHSPGHRANLLNPSVDQVGVAVVESGGYFFAVTDFSQGVVVLTEMEVETKVANLLRAKGILISYNPNDARAYCGNSAIEQSDNPPEFRMRWQTAELGKLPKELVDRVASGHYKLAAVGSCPTQGLEGTFTAYRVGVLLYREGANAMP